MLRVATLFIAIAALSAFAQITPAQEQAATLQAVANREKARLHLSAPTFPSPQPTDEIRDAYPEAYVPRLVRLPDGNLVLSVFRAGYTGDPAYWMVHLGSDGAPVRQIVATFAGDAGRDPPVPARDGGFLLLGHDDGVALATRVDRDGRELWTREFPNFYLWWGQYVGAVATADDGFLLAGSTIGGKIGRGTAFLVERIDRDGNTLWSRVIGNYSRGGSTSLVAAVPDGDFILYRPRRLVRLDAGGRPRWQVAMCCIYAIVPSADGSVLVAGEHHSGPDREKTEPFVARLDRRGRLLWRHIGYPPEAIGSEIMVDGAMPGPDGGAFVMLTHLWDGDGALPGFDTRALARYAANGKLLWWRTVSAGDDPSQPLDLEDAAALPNGQVLITAYDNRATYQRGDLWLRVLPLD